MIGSHTMGVVVRYRYVPESGRAELTKRSINTIDRQSGKRKNDSSSNVYDNLFLRKSGDCSCDQLFIVVTGMS